MSMKILIVEDEKSIADALVIKLEKAGYDMMTARNGKEGLEMSIKEKPDLILLDVIMPVMDGLSMLEELRKDAWGKEAKVIVLTNLTSASEDEIKEYGVEHYLIKADWRIEDLVQKITAVLEK